MQGENRQGFEIPSFASRKIRRKKAFCRERAPGSRGLVCFTSLFVSFLPKDSPHESGGLGPCPSPWEMSSFPSPPLARGSGLARDYSRAPLPLPRPGMGRALVSWEQGNSLAILLTSLEITKLRGNLSLGIFFLAFKAISVSRKLNPCVFGLIT